MLKGEVVFAARITSRHITFPRVTSKGSWPNVEAIEIESTNENGDEISGVVRVAQVGSEAEGILVATTAIEESLSRLVYVHGASIEPARTTPRAFEPMASQAGEKQGSHSTLHVSAFLTLTADVRAISAIKPSDVQATLDAAAPIGERHYWLYRSARSSRTQVEEFLHLYSMLLLLVGEKQSKVDQFIKQVEPGVATSPSPKDGKPETIYTRLRNEVGHHRVGTTPESTRAQMVANVDGLRTVVRSAIAAFP